ncbi:response regulator transcription factor [Streptomyces sp. TRM66268-LWL]|uniref:Response regulator transcription factor n=1 Tax=Streptomyces polyasparticus TaxID=2767826 RepID=A0ABR7SW24_9ACTN|nr:response regulator transcription factor [Streptomyces polyasparticus]MBC9719598.1 response regulator transcription factor [Streptomyces polyasparticus]
MIRVLLADDESVVRFGLRTILEAEGDMEVVAEAGSGVEAVTLTQVHTPEVVVMDVNMPLLDGIGATRRMMDLQRPPRVLMLTAFHLDEKVFSALDAGASGFLLKDLQPGDLPNAVRTVAAGGSMLAPTVTKRLISHVLSGATIPRHDAYQQVGLLSTREAEVLALLGHGLSNADISKQLFIAEGSVKTYVSRMLVKLNLDNRTQLAILAFRAGLVDVASPGTGG